LGRVSKVSFVGYRESVAMALNLIGASESLPDDKLIILKPNLTNADGPPVTTPVEIVEAVYTYCREHCRADVALEGMHLAGTPRRLDTILASFDPVAVDAIGSQMLGHDPVSIEYLRLSDGVLGEVPTRETLAV